MNLPPLPTTTLLRSYGQPYAEGYTEAQLLAYQAATIEACAEVLLESGFRSTGIPAYESLAEKLRSMK